MDSMKVDLQPLSSFLSDLILRTPGATEVLGFQSKIIEDRINFCYGYIISLKETLIYFNLNIYNSFS